MLAGLESLMALLHLQKMSVKISPYTIATGDKQPVRWWCFWSSKAIGLFEKSHCGTHICWYSNNLSNGYMDEAFDCEFAIVKRPFKDPDGNGKIGLCACWLLWGMHLWTMGLGEGGLGLRGQGTVSRCVCVCVCIPLIGTAHITFFKHNVIRLVGANTPTEQGNIMILCHEKLQMEKRLRASQCWLSVWKNARTPRYKFCEFSSSKQSQSKMTTSTSH